MRFRKLRIAWSVGCAIACLLFVVLWVRSYYHYDFASHNFSGKLGFIIESIRGEAFIKYAPGALVINGYGSSTPDRSRPPTGNPAIRTWAGFGFTTNPDGKILTLPFWFLALTTGALAGGPWIRKLAWRFTLRTLLIATTLVAVVLGLIVWAAK